jgi:membrane associated rhomboid family serine protease
VEVRARPPMSHRVRNVLRVRCYSRFAMSEPPAPPPPEEPTIFEKARSSPITFGLAAINVAVMIWASQKGRDTTDQGTLLQFGANEPLHVWAGEYWRLATSMFLHVGWIHLLWNTYASIGWCTAIERALGKKRFLLLYLLSGIGASCVSIVGSMIFGPKISAGASGAMFGIIGATLAIRRRQLPSFSAFFADRGIRSVLVQIAIWTAIGMTALNMDNSAHFGGLVTGFAITWIFTLKARRNAWLAFGVAYAALFVIAARPWWTPSGDDAARLSGFAQAYFTGKAADRDGNLHAWPLDPAEGERLLSKGCAKRVATACRDLAKHIDATGGPEGAERSKELHRRACELEPPLCLQLN